MAAATKGLTIERSGQPHSYADTERAGTVAAETEAEARAILAAYAGVKTLGGRGEAEWYMPYLQDFHQESEGMWRFRIIEAYTG